MSARLTLMGTFHLSVEGATVSLLPSCQRLLACLAIHLHDLPRSCVAGKLWPEKTEERALACLRHVMWEIRRSSGRVLSSDHGMLRIAAGVDIDARQALHELPGTSAEDVWHRMTQAELRTRYGHDLLEDWDHEWIESHRALLREWRLRSLETVITRAAAAGAGSIAIQAALMALEADPYRETAIRKLVEVCLQEGNRALALRHYTEFADRMYAELGVGPVTDLSDMIRSTPRSVA